MTMINKVNEKIDISERAFNWVLMISHINFRIVILNSYINDIINRLSI